MANSSSTPEVGNCRYCGHPALVKTWPASSIKRPRISCINKDCPVKPSTSGATFEEAEIYWNHLAAAAREVC